MGGRLPCGPTGQERSGMMRHNGIAKPHLFDRCQNIPPVEWFQREEVREDDDPAPITRQTALACDLLLVWTVAFWAWIGWVVYAWVLA